MRVMRFEGDFTCTLRLCRCGRELTDGPPSDDCHVRVGGRAAHTYSVPCDRSRLDECRIGEIESCGKLDELVRRNAELLDHPAVLHDSKCHLRRLVAQVVASGPAVFALPRDPEQPFYTDRGSVSSYAHELMPKDFLGAEGQVAEVRCADPGYAHADDLAATRWLVDLDDPRSALPAPHCTHARSHRPLRS